jgi:hypothetical protein
MWRNLRLILLLALVVGGGTIGFLSTASSWSSFTAEVSLPVDPISYRSAETAIDSPAELRRFAAAVGKLQSPEFKLLERQLLNAENVVTFGSVQHLNKRDWRDMPDLMLRQMMATMEDSKVSGTRAPVVKDGKFLDAVVTAKGRDGETAARLAQFAMDYLRHVIHVGALREHLLQWGLNGRNELAKITEQLATSEALLYQTDQKITSMRELGERYKDMQPVGAAPQSNVEVLLSSEFLTPARQIIGLEVGRIKGIADVQMDRLRAAYLTHLTKIADEFIPKLGAGQSPQSVSEEIKERIMGQVPGGDPIDRFALDRARAAVNVALTDIEAHWPRVPTDSEVVVTRPTATPPRWAVLLGAMAVGLMLWLVLVMRRSMMLAFRRLLDDEL